MKTFCGTKYHAYTDVPSSIHDFIPFYFAAPLGKDLIKRTSQRIVAIIGGCLMGGGFVLAAFAESIGVVYLAFFISGKFILTVNKPVS